MRLVGLLHHRPEEAGELGELALQHDPAEVDVPQQPLERIGELPVRGLREHALRHLGEVLGRGDRELVLAVEVVEKASLGESGGIADLVDRGRLVALGADHMQGGVEKLPLRFVLDAHMGNVTSPYQLVWRIHTNRYGVKGLGGPPFSKSYPAGRSDSPAGARVTR